MVSILAQLIVGLIQTTDFINACLGKDQETHIGVYLPISIYLSISIFLPIAHKIPVSLEEAGIFIFREKKGGIIGL